MGLHEFRWILVSPAGLVRHGRLCPSTLRGIIEFTLNASFHHGYPFGSTPPADQAGHAVCLRKLNGSPRKGACNSSVCFSDACRPHVVGISTSVGFVLKILTVTGDHTRSVIIELILTTKIF